MTPAARGLAHFKQASALFVRGDDYTITDISVYGSRRAFKVHCRFCHVLNVRFVQCASTTAFFLSYVWAKGIGIANVEPGPKNIHEDIGFARTLRRCHSWASLRVQLLFICDSSNPTCGPSAPSLVRFRHSLSLARSPCLYLLCVSLPPRLAGLHGLAGLGPL